MARKATDGDRARFTVTVPADVRAQLQAVADERGSSLATVMREAAIYWLRSQSSQRRAS